MMCLLTSISFSQEVIKINKQPNKVIEYDSLNNFMGEKTSAYIGQILTLSPKPENLRKYGYEKFFINYDKSKPLISTSSDNIYKREGFNSNYDSLVNKKFLVKDVIEQNRLMKHQNVAYLKLIDCETNDSLYFGYNTKWSSAFPFIVEGYLDKYINLFKGKEVLIRPFIKTESGRQKKTFDIDSGEEIEIPKGEFFEFLDIVFEENYFDLSILVKDSNSRRFTFPLYYKTTEVQRIFTKDEVEKYQSKFGKENWNIIIQNKVQIGFTEEMVIFTFGKPDKVNVASYGDQWVYPDFYLYFKNGKLTAFN